MFFDVFILDRFVRSIGRIQSAKNESKKNEKLNFKCFQWRHI